MEFELGRVYSGYEFLEVANVASRGALVYQVRNTFVHRRELLYILPSQNDPHQVDRFVREMRVRASLLHPNIVTLFNAGEIEGHLMMTTEMVEGSTLASRLEQGPLPWPEAVGVVRQALAALACAHAQNIVHRDISPENILITPGGVVKLSNFALAKGADSPQLTQAGVIVGNLRYIPPEQVRGDAELDARSDIYSLGAVLYEMLCGRPPFDCKSQFELMLAHVNTPPASPSDVNPEIPVALSAVVLRALAKDPAARYQTASNFEAAFDAVPVPPRMVQAPAYPEASAFPPPLPQAEETAAYSGEAAESAADEFLASPVAEASAFPPPLPQAEEAAAYSGEAAEPAADEFLTPPAAEASVFPPPLPQPEEITAYSGEAAEPSADEFLTPPAAEASVFPPPLPQAEEAAAYSGEAEEPAADEFLIPPAAEVAAFPPPLPQPEETAAYSYEAAEPSADEFLTPPAAEASVFPPPLPQPEETAAYSYEAEEPPADEFLTPPAAEASAFPPPLPQPEETTAYSGEAAEPSADEFLASSADEAGAFPPPLPQVEETAAFNNEAGEPVADESLTPPAAEAIEFPPPLPQPEEAGAWGAEMAEGSEPAAEAVAVPPPLSEPAETTPWFMAPQAEAAPEPLPDLPQDAAPERAELSRVIPFPAPSESAASPEPVPEPLRVKRKGLRVQWAVLGGTAAGIGAGLLAVWFAAGK